MREAVTHVMQAHRLGVTRACGLMGTTRSLYRYESRWPNDEALRTRLCEPASAKRRCGDRRMHELVKREGWMQPFQPEMRNA